MAKFLPLLANGKNFTLLLFCYMDPNSTLINDGWCATHRLV
jgi:hypothetical protein